jgi:hypothetical protein
MTGGAVVGVAAEQIGEGADQIAEGDRSQPGADSGQDRERDERRVSADQ